MELNQRYLFVALISFLEVWVLFSKFFVLFGAPNETARTPIEIKFIYAWICLLGLGMYAYTRPTAVIMA